MCIRDRYQRRVHGDENKFKAFSGKGISLGDAGQQNTGQQQGNDDSEILLAIKYSLQGRFDTKPEESDGTIVLNIRYPNGKAASWNFFADDLVQDVYDFALYSMDDSQLKEFVLSSNFPKKNYEDKNITLEAADISSYSTLMVQYKCCLLYTSPSPRDS
eukprot:TRINITY_DN4455_c0_g1_i8.p2 TRINITY_DN4455_c0_g1~~TRINITY_DN4455_c0_g1_i8.p2  ORF type:complete len:159 (+),score=44.32 TRINITY_DN4455_c0_g1_i8:64-540(+)